MKKTQRLSKTKRLELEIASLRNLYQQEKERFLNEKIQIYKELSRSSFIEEICRATSDMSQALAHIVADLKRRQP